MEYMLALFICGISSSGGSYCEWKDALRIPNQYECQQVLQNGKNWDGTIKLGGGYSLAMCRKISPKVEK